MRPNKIALRELAKLLEGEGYFFCRGTPGIALTMTDQDVVSWAAQVMGGNVHHDNRPPTSKTHKKVSWRTGVYGDRAIDLMLALYPYMFSRRRSQIDLSLKLASQRPGRAMGERHGRSKLTARDVRAIRDSKDTPTKLGLKYGISYRQIRYIILHYNWKHLN